MCDKKRKERENTKPRVNIYPRRTQEKCDEYCPDNSGLLCGSTIILITRNVAFMHESNTMKCSDIAQAQHMRNVNIFELKPSQELELLVLNHFV